MSIGTLQLLVGIGGIALTGLAVILAVFAIIGYSRIRHSIKKNIKREVAKSMEEFKAEFIKTGMRGKSLS